VLVQNGIKGSFYVVMNFLLGKFNPGYGTKFETLLWSKRKFGSSSLGCPKGLKYEKHVLFRFRVPHERLIAACVFQ